MLKCIQFVLSDYYYDILIEKLDQIQEEINPHGAQAGVCTVSVMKEKLSEKINVGEMAQTLYITDDEQMLRRLLYIGAYAIVLYHEKNKDQDFSAALYGMEEVQYLKYRSYEEVYRRLAELPWNILETGRLWVRESTIADVEAFYQIYQEPSITLYMENLFPEPADEKAYMKDYIKQIYGFYGYGLWTVILKETGKIIGRAGLSVRTGYDLPELGFVIDAKYQRQGYAFEVCEAILCYAKEELEFEQVQALVDERNIASQNLLKKLGFHFDREVEEDGQIYGLYMKTLS